MPKRQNLNDLCIGRDGVIQVISDASQENPAHFDLGVAYGFTGGRPSTRQVKALFELVSEGHGSLRAIRTPPARTGSNLSCRLGGNPDPVAQPGWPERSSFKRASPSTYSPRRICSMASMSSLSWVAER